MNKEEFKKYVIAEATKHLFSKESEVPKKTLNTIKENVNIEVTKIQSSTISPLEIKKLAEEMKKINKTIDLRNPLISENGESLVESIMIQNKPGSKGAQLDLEDINKKKHIEFQNEGEKDTWNRVLKYDIPTDEERL